MRWHHALLAVVCMMVSVIASCQNKPDSSRPSGLKNMAPPPANAMVQEGLDVEVNDTFMQAVDISMAGDSSQWTGQLEFGDVDVWHIKAKAGTVADITVIPENDFDVIVDYSMTANEADRRYFDFSLSGKPELLPNMRLTPQGGYLTIRGRNSKTQGPVKYRVLVSRVQSGQGTPEAEPDDTIESAQAILPDEQLNGTLFPAGDVDYYRTVLQKPSQVVFSLPDGSVEVAVESHDHTIWSLISRKAQEVKSDILQENGQILYVRIKSLDSPEDVLHYGFKVVPIEDIPDEMEPNDSVSQAQKVNLDGLSSLSFHLKNETDVDVFEIQTEPGQSYSLRLTGVDSMFARIQLLSSNGQPVDGVSSENTTVCGFRGREDKIYIQVSPLMKAAAYPMEYHLVLDSEAGSSVEVEPNQVLSQATNLDFDVHMKSHIFPSGDVDVYRINVPTVAGADGVAGILKVELEAGYPTQLSMKLLDAEGFEISQMSNDQMLKMSFDAPAGVYYLEVSGSGDKCMKSYEFHVGFMPGIEQNIQHVGEMPTQNTDAQKMESTGDESLDDLLNTAMKGSQNIAPNGQNPPSDDDTF